MTVMQLTRDYYQDAFFVEQRLKLWPILKKLPDDKLDFQKIIGLVCNDRTSELKTEEVIALNRTAAFYHSVRSLTDRGEVDIEILRDF